MARRADASHPSQAGGRRTANARRADGDAANNRAGRKGARRRTGGKVTLDEQQDIQVGKQRTSNVCGIVP